MNTAVATTEPRVRNLRGLPLIKALRDLLSEPEKMAEKTGLKDGAIYDQRRAGRFRLDCGAEACLTGWSMFLSGAWDGKSIPEYSLYDVLVVTGMDIDDVTSLFVGNWYRWGEWSPKSGSLNNRSADEAVRVLTRIIEEMEAGQAA